MGLHASLLHCLKPPVYERTPNIILCAQGKKKSWLEEDPHLASTGNIVISFVVEFELHLCKVTPVSKLKQQFVTISPSNHIIL